MTDQQAPSPRVSERRTVVGKIPVTANDSEMLTVSIVERSWATKGKGRVPVVTHAPPGIEVRRDPERVPGEPGGMTPAAALALAAALSAAAKRAEQIGAAPAPRRVRERRS